MPNNSKCKILVFDIDGTIVDSPNQYMMNYLNNRKFWWNGLFQSSSIKNLIINDLDYLYLQNLSNNVEKLDINLFKEFVYSLGKILERHNISKYLSPNIFLSLMFREPITLDYSKNAGQIECAYEGTENLITRLYETGIDFVPAIVTRNFHINIKGLKFYEDLSKYSNNIYSSSLFDRRFLIRSSIDEIVSCFNKICVTDKLREFDDLLRKYRALKNQLIYVCDLGTDSVVTRDIIKAGGKVLYISSNSVYGGLGSNYIGSSFTFRALVNALKS